MARPFRKKLNPKLIEKHRTYSVAELAALYGVEKVTVFRWVRNGLLCIDNLTPHLIFGEVLIHWINKHRPTKSSLENKGKVFCVKCKDHVFFDSSKAMPKKAPPGRVFFQSRCPACNSLVNKIFKKGDITLEEIQKRLVCCFPASTKVHKKEDIRHDSIQQPKRADQMALF